MPKQPSESAFCSFHAEELMRLLHRTVADIYEMLDPRSPTQHQNSVEARAKAKMALKVAADFGVLS
jgi:hypothetical protein